MAGFIYIRHDKNEIQLFPLQHLSVVGVITVCAKNLRAGLGLCRIQVAHGYEIHRNILKCGVDIPKGVSATTDKSATQFIWILVVVSNRHENEKASY